MVLMKLGISFKRMPSMPAISSANIVFKYPLVKKPQALVVLKIKLGCSQKGPSWLHVNLIFNTTSACGFLTYTQYAKLIEKGYVPLKDASYLTNGYLNTILADEIPGMEGIRLKDIPSFIRTMSLDEYMVKFALQETQRALRAFAIILNSFEDLEQDCIKTLSSILPPVYAIEPLHFLQKDVKGRSLEIIRSNLWKDDQHYLEWLLARFKRAYLLSMYVNFRSIIVMTPKQLIKFSWGLANNNRTFQWIIRSGLVSGDDAILPPKFFEATKERSLLANWSPQEKEPPFHWRILNSSG
ncbi:unnamed protein product [Fraxinus pennsylvanica]|uniref:Uncharacterized protein n=1 Tax=Fraxinus pennsylvanica TaxID=56036 RepID=A0AAD2DTB5_9LAMI|nr:unnamed protein product [Fraxinus pennsylvanica]